MIDEETGTGEVVGREESAHVGVEELTTRAEVAEHRSEQLASQVASLEAELADLAATQEQAEAARQLETLLRKAGAVDIEAAQTLAAELIESEELDAPEAVATLKRDKQFLFATPTQEFSAMSGGGRIGSDLEQVASAARSTGDRRELLRYMRLRRCA